MHRVDRAFNVKNLTASIPSYHILKGDVSRTISLLPLSIIAFRFRSAVISAHLPYTDGTNHTEVSPRRFRAVEIYRVFNLKVDRNTRSSTVNRIMKA